MGVEYLHSLSPKLLWNISSSAMSSTENDCANAKNYKESHPFCLDDILVKVGQFGRFHFRFFFLAFILMIFYSAVKYGFIFTAGTVVYRCRVPECDGLEDSYQKPWTEFSIPKAASGQLDKCQRYKTFNSTSAQNFCDAENYDHEFRIDCGDDLIFQDEEITISNDFKIVCSHEWKLAMVGTVNSLGHFIGIPLGGYCSDRYGRVPVLAYAGFASAVLGIIRTFSPNYYMFIVFGFLDNFFGSTLYGTIFVLATEILGPSIRVYALAMIPTFTSIARVIIGFAAKNIHNWRWMERIFYIPALAFISFHWIVPESARWLLCQGEEEKAVKILQNTAKINKKRKLSEISIEKLLKANRESLTSAEVENNNKFLLVDAFNTFPWRIINCSLCWFTLVMVHFGLSLNLDFLGGNKFDSFIFLSLVEIPGMVLPFLTINCLGRKLTLFGYMLLSGICIIASNSVSSDSGSLQLMLYLLGKMTISTSFQTLYIFTSEIFPTNARNTLLSFCSMIGRIGAMVAPQTPLMAKYYAPAPTILFAGSSFLSGSLVLFLPETKDTVLPATLQDANKIGQDEIKVESEIEGDRNNVGRY